MVYLPLDVDQITINTNVSFIHQPSTILISRVKPVKQYARSFIIANCYCCRFGNLSITTTIKKQLQRRVQSLMQFKKFLLDYMYDDWWLATTMPKEMANELPVSSLACVYLSIVSCTRIIVFLSKCHCTNGNITCITNFMGLRNKNKNNSAVLYVKFILKHVYQFNLESIFKVIKWMNYHN